MNVTAQQMAPGCFGSASAYSMDSTVCQGCVAFAECGEESIKTLQSIRELVDVRDYLKRHEAARAKAGRPAAPAYKAPLAASPVTVGQPTLDEPIARATAPVRTAFAVSASDQAVIDLLGTKNVKAMEQALVLCKGGKVGEMRAGLPLQRNPFTKTGPKYLRVACDMLMRGGFTKAEYKARMVQELGWAENTAGSHVAVACALLYAFEIAIPDTSGAFVINPKLMQQNETINP